MFNAAPFDDGRGRYPDKLTTSIPRGLWEALRQAADREHVSLSEFVRAAIQARLSHGDIRREHGRAGRA